MQAPEKREWSANSNMEANIHISPVPKKQGMDHHAKIAA